MKDKPENWASLSLDEKRSLRLEAWLASADEIEFDSLEAKEKYIKRLTLIKDSVELKKQPERVPVSSLAAGFAMKRAGVKQKAAIYDDWNCAGDAVIKYHEEFQPDTSSDIFFMSGKSMEMLGVTTLKWPGCDLPDDSPYQALEVEVLKSDEYDWFIRDPSDFMLRAYLPRTNSGLAGLSKMPRFSTDSLIPLGVGVGRFFMDPEVQEALDILKTSAEMSMESLQASMRVADRLTAKGFPPLSGMGAGATGTPPYDILGDNLRGTKGIMMDIFRQPEKLLEACDKLLELLPVPDVPLGGCPLVMLPLHKGDDAHMSDAQFEKFYWPTFKESLMKLINEGLIPLPFAEGSYDRRLDFIAELPPRSTVWFFDQTDMKRAKDVLSDKCCIMGNVPISMITTGKPAEITKYCRDLIEYCGRDGGFILAPGCQIDNTTEENMRAFISAATQSSN